MKMAITATIVLFAITIAGGRFIALKPQVDDQEARVIGVASSLLGGLTFNNYVILMRKGENSASSALISFSQILEMKALENQCINIVGGKSNFEYKKIPCSEAFQNTIEQLHQTH